MAKKPTITTPNSDLLSDEQRKALVAKARETVNKKRTEAAEDAFLQEAIRREELADKPLEQTEFFMLDLPGHMPWIMLDGVQYFHGETYEFTRGQLNTVREIVARGWQHEEDVGGANRDLYRRPRNTTLASSGMVRSGPLDPTSGHNVQAV